MENQSQQPEKTKAELFAEKPEEFVHVSELIIAIKRTEHGSAVCLNPRTRNEMVWALGEIQVKLMTEIMIADAVKQEESRGSIVQPKGAIKSFANRMLRRR